MRARLRSFFLFVIFVVSWLAIGYVVELAVRTWHLAPRGQGWHPSFFIFVEYLTAAVLLVASLIVVWVGKRSLRDLGYAPARAGRLVANGSVIGIAAPMLLILAIAALGGFTFGHVAMRGTNLLAYALSWLVAMFGVGISEEMMFRGPALLLLGESIGFWPAALVTNFAFAAIHYWGKGPTETVADGLSVGLIGLLLAFTVKRTGSIWWAVGFHALFDYVALYVLGAPNSGNDGKPIATRLLTGGYHGPAWLTGGVLGIEASWLIFPIIALLFLGVHFATRRQAAYHLGLPQAG